MFLVGQLTVFLKTHALQQPRKLPDKLKQPGKVQHSVADNDANKHPKREPNIFRVVRHNLIDTRFQRSERARILAHKRFPAPFYFVLRIGQEFNYSSLK